MKTEAGLWIDHRKAIIVTVSEAGEEVKQIDSGVAGKHRRDGDTSPEGSRASERAPADDIQQRIQTEHLNAYYDTVIEALRGAESILVLGPGEAKDEMKARLDHKKLGARVVGVEAADKMTDRQIAAKVRRHFTA